MRKRSKKRKNKRRKNVSRKNKRRKNKSRNLTGGSFAATLKAAIVPLFLLGTNQKYKGKKTARKIRKKRKRIKNITMKIIGRKKRRK